MSESLGIKCGLTEQQWSDQKAHHDDLEEIFHDYSRRIEDMNGHAVSISGILQRLPGVHSVRWRVKNPHHLIAKICRKKAKAVEKYNCINVENYRDIVNDLVGVRVLHLIKDEFPKLHKLIDDTWNFREPPFAYVRKGDATDLRDMYADLGLRVEDHADGYRSIHYIIDTNFTKQTVTCELQVRTIFEEGWSEIDHKIRYPEYTDEPIIKEFLHIFNRLAGAADEMGTFVNKLMNDVNSSRTEAARLHKKLRDNDDEKISIIEKLSKASKLTASQSKEIEKLRKLVDDDRARRSVFDYTRQNPFNITPPNYGSLGLVINPGIESPPSILDLAARGLPNTED